MSESPTTSAATIGQAAELADIKKKSVRGGMITFASQGISIVIQLTSTVILARLLSPSDYGVMAMVAAATGLAGLLRDLGLSTAAIQKHNLTNAQQSNLFWINVALGLTLTVILAAASPLVVWFYHRPEVLWVTVALSTSFLIGSLAAQSGALLVRNMRFGRQATAGISGAVLSLAVAVTLALHGFRYWSLVWGQLAGAVATASLMFFLSPFRPGLPRRGTGVREMLKFGAHITAFDFVNYFHRNLDNILIGKFCGAGPLGLYSRAYALLMFPIANLRGPINAVGFPALSRLQNQPAAFRNYYRRVTSMLALVSMPFTAFLFLAAVPIIQIALGAQWSGVVPIFAILATVGFVQPVITLWGMVLLSRGMGRRYLHVGILNSAACAGGFLAGIHWGPVGVATGYAVATYLTAYPVLAWTFHGTPLCFQDFLASILRPCTASVIATLICLLASAYIGVGGAPMQITKMVSLFAPSYFLVFLFLPGGKTELLQFGNLLLSLLPRRANATT